MSRTLLYKYPEDCLKVVLCKYHEVMLELSLFKDKIILLCTCSPEFLDVS